MKKLPKTLQEFEKLRACSDYSSTNKFFEAIHQGNISQQWPLGALLSLRSASRTLPEELQSAGSEVYRFHEGMHVGRLFTAYGLRLDDWTLLFNFDEVPELGLASFIDRWYEGSKRKSSWNPRYAQKSLPLQVRDFCAENNFEHFLKTFNIARINYIPTSNQDRQATYIQSTEEPERVLLPFSGWQIAECARLIYRGR